MRGYGNAVVIDHGGGVTTLYGHLEAIRVESGDAVPAGAVIGTVGRSGNATTYHVHFEIRVDGESVDPLAQLRS
jgi:murein DD-endopeptidase MepM/ murein hydrolase activator NlpD